MKNVLIVNGSVREGRSSDNILALVQAELANYPEYGVTVADFKAMPLPFMTSALSPSADDFVAPEGHVATWLQIVEDADAIIMLVAEYNHSYTPVIKNAIDWGFKQWQDKPVALVAYGWSGGTRATTHLRGVLGSTINTKTVEAEANLRFMKDINVDGTVMDQAAVTAAIKAPLDELLGSA